MEGITSPSSTTNAGISQEEEEEPAPPPPPPASQQLMMMTMKQQQQQQVPSLLVVQRLLPPLPPSRLAAEILVSTDEGKRLYWDRSHYDSPASQVRALKRSSTLYVGNLSFTTRSKNLYSHFSLIGLVKTIHLGLDRLRKTPCGFCFVEYRNRHDALQAVVHLSGTKLDGNVIRVELDAGFQPGRQYGRGVSGGQVRDDRRKRSFEGTSGGGGGSSNSNAVNVGAKRGRDQLLQSSLSTPRSTAPLLSSTSATNNNNNQKEEEGGGDGSGEAPAADNDAETGAGGAVGQEEDTNDEADEPSAKRQRMS